MAPPLPSRRARQRLADAIVAALREPEARRSLATLARDAEAAARWLGPEAARERGAVMARAHRASIALATLPFFSPVEELTDALEAAAQLFDAGLYFEAHEVLEPHWRRASGDAREALQGLIQIAVGHQHRVNGNARGARSLLGQGARRVRGRQVLGIHLDRFAETAPALPCLQARGRP